MTTSTGDHIDRFLAAIDSQGTFRRIMEALVTRAKADPATNGAVQAMKDWLAKPLVSREVEARLQSYDPLAHDVPDPVLAGSPSIRLALAVGYLRAQERLRALAASAKPPVQTILDQLPHVPEHLGSLEPDFVSELLLETQRRAAVDPVFVGSLRQALRDVQSVHPQASAWARVLLARQGVTLLAAHCNLSGGPFECGVVVAFIVILVIVVVAK